MDDIQMPEAMARSFSETAMDREEVFNEVIHGLGILKEALKQAQTVSNDNWRGVEIAMAYVKAMKKAEE